MSKAYDELPQNAANHVALSPCSFLARTAAVYPHDPAIVYGARRISWQETYQRCRQFASQLRVLGIQNNDTVSTLLPNIPAMIEAHFAVPMAGAVINTLNTRLDARTIAFMLEHAESKVLLVDPEFVPLAREALALVAHPVIVIDVPDETWTGESARIGSLEYESWLAAGAADFVWALPEDEWDAISLNYTSGTTGNPKGVVFHHRGAYLNAVNNMLACRMLERSVYLWIVPLFHCNGWCFAWTMAANGGTSICMRKVDPVRIFQLIAEHKVTHFGGAPTVMTMLINTPAEQRRPIDHTVEVLVAGAAPPEAVIEGMAEMGLNVHHVYGLTETYGPAALCAPQEAWRDLLPAARAERLSRQGVPYHMQEAMRVLDPVTLQPVPPDGTTVGEVMFRGNIVMKGYLKNPQATTDAFAGGWFHSGDLAVCHADGYAKVIDRSKDVIISGGENISSLEVEEVLYRHPAVLLAAVVAMPHEKWQEVPCAFVELKPGLAATPEELLAYCRQHLARFKVPKEVVIREIPKTATGKLQKFVLRDWLKSRV